MQISKMVSYCIFPLFLCWLGIFLRVGCIFFLLGGWSMAYSASCLGRGLCSLRGILCCVCRVSVSPCVFPSLEFAIMFLVAGSFWIRYSLRYTVLAGWIKSFLLLILFLIFALLVLLLSRGLQVTKQEVFNFLEVHFPFPFLYY